MGSGLGQLVGAHERSTSRETGRHRPALRNLRAPTEWAVRQGPLITDNLRAAVTGASLRHYRPQRDFLTLLNAAGGVAMVAKWGRSFQGRWVMTLKDRIDRRFTRRFQVSDA